VNGITSALYDASQFRLQAALEVVHQLTPEQRRYLKVEMAKPDSEKGILEAVAKVFHLSLMKMKTSYLRIQPVVNTPPHRTSFRARSRLLESCWVFLSSRGRQQHPRSFPQ